MDNVHPFSAMLNHHSDQSVNHVRLPLVPNPTLGFLARSCKEPGASSAAWGKPNSLGMQPAMREKYRKIPGIFVWVHCGYRK